MFFQSILLNCIFLQEENNKWSNFAQGSNRVDISTIGQVKDIVHKKEFNFIKEELHRINIYKPENVNLIII